MKRPKRTERANDSVKRTYTEIVLTDEYRAQHKLPVGVKAYRFSGGCTVLAGMSAAVGWHLTIAHSSRLPKWEEINAAVIALIPEGVRVSLILPLQRIDKEDIKRNVLHLYQVRTEVRDVRKEQPIQGSLIRKSGSEEIAREGISESEAPS
jgi:hypothetical protein